MTMKNLGQELIEAVKDAIQKIDVLVNMLTRLGKPVSLVIDDRIVA